MDYGAVEKSMNILIGCILYVVVAAMVKGGLKAYYTWPNRHTVNTHTYPEDMVAVATALWPLLPFVVVLHWFCYHLAIFSCFILQLAQQAGYKLVLLVEPKGQLDAIMARQQAFRERIAKIFKAAGITLEQ